MKGRLRCQVGPVPQGLSGEEWIRHLRLLSARRESYASSNRLPVVDSAGPHPSTLNPGSLVGNRGGQLREFHNQPEQGAHAEAGQFLWRHSAHSSFYLGLNYPIG